MSSNNVNDVAYKSKRGYKQDLLFNNQIVWMTTRRAAAYLDISPNALRIRISRGKVIPDRYLDDKYPRFRRENLDKLLVSFRRGGK